MKRHCLVLVGLAALVGCAGESTTEPRLVQGAAVAFQVAASASGGGQAQLPAGFSLLNFGFAANDRGDGSAVGQFRQHYESAGGIVDFHGTVTCVSFDAANNRAWIGGVVTQNNSTHPAMMGAIHQPGRDVWFRVVDNGQGQDANPDRTTVLGFEGAAGILTSAAYCATQPWAANDANTWAVVSGNIQVRP